MLERCKTQSADGSWPMTSRDHPGVVSTRKPIRNPVPITYFGSAWAAIGLVRSVAPAADSLARQQAAFDRIKGFHGKFEVDEKAPDRPVLRVDLRYYELSDREVADFVKALQAFPRMEALWFKSSKVTDAGLPSLKDLKNLRGLTLENAQITDAGLVHLQALAELEALNVKGTKITDAGLEAFRKARPKVRIEKQ